MRAIRPACGWGRPACWSWPSGSGHRPRTGDGWPSWCWPIARTQLELMWGSPGTILAARTCGLEDEWRASAEILEARCDAATDMWPHELTAGGGRTWARPTGSRVPSMLCGAWSRARPCVRASTACWGAAPCVMTAWSTGRRRRAGERIWPPRSASSGAMGARLVATLGDLMPVRLALDGGELIWRAGPLAKGPGLCHGTAGNGYAFLRLHALTGDELWLMRARRFAMHAVEQVERQRQPRAVAATRCGPATSGLRCTCAPASTGPRTSPRSTTCNRQEAMRPSARNVSIASMTAASCSRCGLWPPGSTRRRTGPAARAWMRSIWASDP